MLGEEALKEGGCKAGSHGTRAGCVRRSAGASSRACEGASVGRAGPYQVSGLRWLVVGFTWVPDRIVGRVKIWSSAHGRRAGDRLGFFARVAVYVLCRLCCVTCVEFGLRKARCAC